MSVDVEKDIYRTLHCIHI